ncbi:MAG: phosphopantetheine-binding protein [Holophaga sp.]|nr:phosphopantetheine-binding protein [Holophaga sp.]
MDVLETVQSTIRRMTKGRVPSNGSVSLFESGLIDSFGILELIASLEEELGVKVPDSELLPSRFETVDKIVAYFRPRL